MDPHRSELRLGPGSPLLGCFECRLLRLLVGHRFDLQTLSDALQVGNAGALDSEWLLPELSGPVVADQPVGALPQRVVREVALPLNDCRPLFHLARGGKQGLVNRFRRCLREYAGRNGQYGEKDRYQTFHFITSNYSAGTCLPRERQQEYTSEVID